MKRALALFALLTALPWAPAMASLAARWPGMAGHTAYLLGQDDHWTRQRQKEDKSQAPLLENNTAHLGDIFS